jgi:hypothetical protein
MFVELWVKVLVKHIIKQKKEMAKNIPITARVSRGLFGQKATEPVLNVGQAGAYGNNVTKGDPSPTKMMNSPFKQQVHKSKGTGDLEQGQAYATIGSKEPDTVVKGKTTVIPGKKYVPVENDWWNSLTPEQKAEHNKKTKAKIANDPEYQPTTIQEDDTIIKGKDTTEKIPLTTFNEGSAKTSYWRRQDDRSVTHTSRKKKAADIKLAKIAAKRGYTTSVDKDGNEVKTAITNKSEHIKNAKLDAKEEMWESRKAGYEGSRDAAIKQNQQSVMIHGAVKGVNLDPEGQQILHANQVGSKKGYTSEEDATTQAKAQKGFNISEKTETDTEVTNPATNKPAGEAAEAKSDDVETGAKKSANGFFAKKSPLKMKYFK